MSTQLPTYREVERKYLVQQGHEDIVPADLLGAPSKTIEQYYINHASEPYELRLRRTEDDHGKEAYVATLKSGTPPDRLEMETPIAPDTYSLWQEQKHTEVISKKRRVLQFAAGHWALDQFTRFDFSLVEAEGDVSQPDFGRDVTDDTRFTNYELAQLNDLLSGYLPDSLQKPPEPSDIKQVHTLIEFIRGRKTGPILIGVAGGTASGKTTLARELAQAYGEQAVIISQDDYYHGVDKMLELFGEGHLVNFDAPESINLELLATHLDYLVSGNKIERPTYSMVTSNPTGEYEIVDPSKTPMIFVEGIFALDPTLKDAFDLTIFANAPLATRVGRRLERDLAEGRSYDPEDNLRYLLEVAEPTYNPHGKAQKAAADIVFNT